VSMRRTARIPLALLAAVACLSGLCPLLSTAARSESMQRKTSKTGKADHEIPLGGLVRVDRNCAGIGAPQIDLESPPMHGIVCQRPGEVKLEYVVSDASRHCLGTKAVGVRIFYRPHDGYTGKDAARYIARFPKDQVNVDVDLTIVPDDRPSLNRAPAPGAPAPEAQKPGPMPVCAGLVS
jgi:hypothetical protein